MKCVPQVFIHKGYNVSNSTPKPFSVWSQLLHSSASAPALKAAQFSSSPAQVSAARKPMTKSCRFASKTVCVLHDSRRGLADRKSWAVICLDFSRPCHSHSAFIPEEPRWCRPVGSAATRTTGVAFFCSIPSSSNIDDPALVHDEKNHALLASAATAMRPAVSTSRSWKMRSTSCKNLCDPFFPAFLEPSGAAPTKSTAVPCKSR
mmetsp:Transcript_53680/g.152120  ORF Transcript_53680/g.152120 Transcript_53680/m.152120 type:complete len:205 (+) Transcript_53680:134-748(+)